MSTGLFEHIELADVPVLLEELKARLHSLIEWYWHSTEPHTVTLAGVDEDPWLDVSEGGVDDAYLYALTLQGPLIRAMPGDKEEEPTTWSYEDLSLDQLLLVATRLDVEEKRWTIAPSEVQALSTDWDPMRMPNTEWVRVLDLSELRRGHCVDLSKSPFHKGDAMAEYQWAEVRVIDHESEDCTLLVFEEGFLAAGYPNHARFLVRDDRPTGAGWVCTDPDNEQYMRVLEEGKHYEFSERGVEKDILLSMYDVKTINSVLETYGYSPALREHMLETEPAIVAECIFEQESGLY
jgi:hypothetical protein